MIIKTSGRFSNRLTVVRPIKQSVQIICRPTAKPLSGSTVESSFGGMLTCTVGVATVVEESRIDTSQISHLASNGLIQPTITYSAIYTPIPSPTPTPTPEDINRWIYVDASYYGEGQDTMIMGLIDDAIAAGYNGIVSATSQWTKPENWSVVYPDGTHTPLSRMQNVRQYCRDKNFRFIAQFMGMDYSDNYVDDPASDVLAEGIPATNMRYIVRADGSITPDADDLLTRCNFQNNNFSAQAAPRDHNWWSASNYEGWFFSPNADNYYDPNARAYPLIAYRDITVTHGGQPYSIKFAVPSTGGWLPNHTYAATTDTLYPPNSILRIGNNIFFSIAGGVSGATEPDWTKNQYGTPITLRPAGQYYTTDTLMDGTVKWTYFGSYRGIMENTVWAGITPHTYIHISFWVKFDSYVGSGPQVSAIGRSPGVRPAQYCLGAPGWSEYAIGSTSSPYTADWYKVNLILNTQEWPQITLEITTDHTAGTMWMSELTIEPAGIMNILRRDSTPFIMTSLDGLTTYTEGVDYTDATDPYLRLDPTIVGGPSELRTLNGGRSQWHTIPTMRKAGSTLHTDQVVLCSYYHIGFYRGAWKPCPSNVEYIARNRVIATYYRDLLDPDAYFTNHDEIRMMGWDPDCLSHGSTGGALAYNIDACYGILHSLDPTKPIWTWNDMFDPYHNALVYPIYQNAGGHAGSWVGLNTNIGIVNWNYGMALVDTSNTASAGGIEQYKRSMDFFQSLGLKQIVAGYYDSIFTEHPTYDPLRIRYAQNERYSGDLYATWVFDCTKFQEFMGVVLANE